MVIIILSLKLLAHERQPRTQIRIGQVRRRICKGTVPLASRGKGSHVEGSYLCLIGLKPQHKMAYGITVASESWLSLVV
jgi:hypothetical protein